MGRAMTDMIRVEDVEVVYGNGVQALRRMSVAIKDSEVTVLLGPSGAGKSTLLRTLNLLTPPTSGRVVAEDVGPLTSAAAIRRHRRDTAIVFQQHQLIGRLTALQNVLIARLGRHSFWRSLAPASNAERRLALACLDRVALFEKALTRCDSLSGGQQQRVGIARALAQEPKLILADEPVASLDPATSRRVLSQLRDISKTDGIPVVVSLHQLEYAREFADRIIGLSGGRIVFDDAPEQLDDAALAAIYGA
ncbi:MAG: phosphonate ABC transporter ATP-binding protein [Pseudomonadota bacterium]